MILFVESKEGYKMINIGDNIHNNNFVYTVWNYDEKTNSALLCSSRANYVLIAVNIQPSLKGGYERSYSKGLGFNTDNTKANKAFHKYIKSIS